MKSKHKSRIKIVLSMVFAFVLVSYGSPRVFVANTPTVNTLVWHDIRFLPSRTFAYMRYPFDKESRQAAVETAQINTTKESESLEYKPVMKGVSAAEVPNSDEVVVRLEAGTELEVRYITLADGQQVKVYVPVTN